jgi:hypothetical protein
LQTEVDAPLDRPRVYEATLPLTPDGADGLAVFLLNGTSFRVANLYWHQMEGEIGRLAEAGKDREAARLRAARRAEGAASHSRPNPATLHTAPLPRLFLDYVEIEGPLYEQWPPRSHQALLEGAGEARDLEAGRRVLARLARRAFRRPLSEAELEPLVGVVARELRRGEPFEEALKAGVVAVLCSPRFLYLSSAPSGDAHALATRLSYFLWSSMPDDELFELAEAGTLGEPGTLDRQVNRMLRDPRADALATDFAAQWLKVREFDRFRPDEELYPAYHRAASAGLGEALKAEPLQFFREVLRSDLDVRCFLEADWAMVNEPLARFYGLEGVKGDEFRKVALPPGSPRGGLLGMAGVHQWGSDGSRTRPVERGKYILDVLLGDPPPPPPPNAGEVEPNVPGQLLTVRQRLERHQQIPACAACHRRIDPYGLALENWSAIGQWRQRQDGERRNWGDAPPVDASGQLPDGRRFADFLEFRRLLRGEAGRFERALAEKLFVYALGRRLGPADRPEVDRLVARMQASGHTLRTLLKAIVSSETFRTP